jgi:hypothetical protein
MKLKRTAQCVKCPWLKRVNPFDIPDGYDVAKHAALACTIAEPGALLDFGAPLQVMACHETDDAHCVGWLHNQLGEGNNIRLRIAMHRCENIGRLRLRGAQHATFADTLPTHLQATKDAA